MTTDLSTQLWMLGVVSFGITFYVFAMRYAKHCEEKD